MRTEIVQSVSPARTLSFAIPVFGVHNGKRPGTLGGATTTRSTERNHGPVQVGPFRSTLHAHHLEAAIGPPGADLSRQRIRIAATKLLDPGTSRVTPNGKGGSPTSGISTDRSMTSTLPVLPRASIPEPVNNSSDIRFRGPTRARAARRSPPSNTGPDLRSHVLGSKSVSITALVGGDDRVRPAHRESVRAALERYTQARIGNVHAPETTGKPWLEWLVAA